MKASKTTTLMTAAQGVEALKESGKCRKDLSYCKIGGTSGMRAGPVSKEAGPASVELNLAQEMFAGGARNN